MGDGAAIAVRDKAQLLPTLLYKKRGGWIEPGLGRYRIRLYTALKWVHEVPSSVHATQPCSGSNPPIPRLQVAMKRQGPFPSERGHVGRVQADGLSTRDDQKNHMWAKH